MLLPKVRACHPGCDCRAIVTKMSILCKNAAAKTKGLCVDGGPLPESARPIKSDKDVTRVQLRCNLSESCFMPTSTITAACRTRSCRRYGNGGPPPFWRHCARPQFYSSRACNTLGYISPGMTFCILDPRAARGPSSSIPAKCNIFYSEPFEFYHFSITRSGLCGFASRGGNRVCSEGDPSRDCYR